MKHLVCVLTLMIIFFNLVVLHDFSNSSGQNQLLLIVLFISPLIVLINFSQLEKKDLIVVPIIGIMLFSYVLYPEKFRFTTVIYSILFILQFLAFKGLIKINFNLKKFCYIFITYL